MSDYTATKTEVLAELQKSMEKAQKEREDEQIIARLLLLKYILDIDALLENRQYTAESIFREIEKTSKVR